MGTKYRLSVKTAALAGVVMFLLAGCAQISQWEDTLQQPREWDGCALGGALVGAAVFGISSYFVADQTGGDTDRSNVKAVYIPIFTILGGGLGAVAGHYICDPIIPPPPPAPVVAEAPPPPPPPPPPAPQERIVLRGVHFDFNKSNIRPDAVPILDEAAEILGKHPDVTVDVNGYCDAIGSYAYNLRLSQRRANSVARYLEGKGIAANRLVTHGYGKTHFVATNRNAEGRAQNRRVELVPVGS
ncbi:MAG: OmpA family protein [Candidatus Binataceae bacterium]